MSRTVSETFRRALYAAQTDEVIVALLTITHDDLAEPVRLSTDATERLSADPLSYGTTSRGEVYQFVPISVVLSGETDDAPPQVALEVDNVDQSLITMVRSITAPASVAIEIVLASDPDTGEIEFPAMLTGSADYDAEVVRFSLEVDSLASEPFPGTSFVPSMFPGLF